MLLSGKRRRGAPRGLVRFAAGVSGVAALLAGVSAGSASAQTVYGPNGLFVHPTAYIQPRGTFNFNFSFLQVDPANGTSINNWIPMSVSYGINEKFHAGLTSLVRRQRGRTENSYGAFFRGQLADGSRDGTQVAVNLSFMGGDIKQGAAQIVASRVIAPSARRGPIVGHAGVQMVGRGDLPGEDSETAVGAFLGVEVPLAPSLRLVAEGATKLSFDKRPASSVGVMYAFPNSNVDIGLGYVNAGRSRTNEFFFGIGFPLGEGRKKKDDTGATPPTRGVGFPIGEGGE